MLFINYLYRKIPLNKIVCELKEVSEKEGWGGKSINHFPVYKYYKIYYNGNCLKAKELMFRWYYDRFIIEKLYLLPKQQGGMLYGSLYRFIEKEHKKQDIILNKNLTNAKDSLVKDCIRQRVKLRFSLLDSIVKKGFEKTNDPIILQKKGDLYYIIGGHHRIATMSVCGYKYIPAIINNTYNKLLIKIDRVIFN